MTTYVHTLHDSIINVIFEHDVKPLPKRAHPLDEEPVCVEPQPMMRCRAALSVRKLAIVDVLRRRGPLSTAEVLDALRGQGFNALQTAQGILRRMVDDGALKRTRPNANAEWIYEVAS